MGAKRTENRHSFWEWRFFAVRTVQQITQILWQLLGKEDWNHGYHSSLGVEDVSLIPSTEVFGEWDSWRTTGVCLKRGYPRLQKIVSPCRKIGPVSGKVLSSQSWWWYDVLTSDLIVGDSKQTTHWWVSFIDDHRCRGFRDVYIYIYIRSNIWIPTWVPTARVVSAGKAAIFRFRFRRHHCQ